MRRLLFTALCVGTTALASAQQPPAANQLFTSAGDLTAMIAKARTERRPDQANFVQPILALAPYRANLEYRAAGVNANATVHDKDAEMFYVVEGSGTAIIGGTLRDGRKTNADNSAGVAIDGGTSRRITKGDWIMVPEGTAHWFGEIDGALVLMSLHLPHAR